MGQPFDWHTVVITLGPCRSPLVQGRRILKVDNISAPDKTSKGVTEYCIYRCLHQGVFQSAQPGLFHQALMRVRLAAIVYIQGKGRRKDEYNKSNDRQNHVKQDCRYFVMGNSSLRSSFLFFPIKYVSLHHKEESLSVLMVQVLLDLL